MICFNMMFKLVLVGRGHIEFWSASLWGLQVTIRQYGRDFLLEPSEYFHRCKGRGFHRAWHFCFPFPQYLGTFLAAARGGRRESHILQAEIFSSAEISRGTELLGFYLIAIMLGEIVLILNQVWPLNTLTFYVGIVP